jgi:Copper type II ascorbate-dependent monooxygenase, C-terminal domain
MRVLDLGLLGSFAFGMVTACAPAPLVCDAGLVLYEGACIDPVRRYEPSTQLDANNVIAFGDPIAELDLPPPPKSGFRIVAPPRMLAAGEEVDFCLSWPIPELTHNVVHSARLYTTTGLHHSNVVAKPIVAKYGPNPYPDCHPGASDPVGNIGAGIPDVLFANSTQIEGQETIAFASGMGYVLDTTREISTDIHFLNTHAEPRRIEVVYDFFTMPRADLTQEVAPFVVNVEEFSIPPHTTEVVEASCTAFGGNVVTIMPHTHDLATRFTVDLIDPNNQETRVFDDGAFDLESDIRRFEPALDISSAERIRHRCTFVNTRDVEVHYGIGTNEMCTFFGYIYPPEKQFAGTVTKDNGPCNSIQLGLFR